MEKNDEKNESNKPNPSPFHQQKLSGWQPIITTNNLYISFFAIGIIFIAIGSALVYYSYMVNEVTVNYTDCLDSQGLKCADQLIKNNYTFSYKSCQCLMNITIAQDMKGPAFVYYGLTNFFQNHRRYVNSRDDNQLKGLDVNNNLNFECEPFRYANSTTLTAYAPCGTIANSLFNDTFVLEYVYNNSVQVVPWTNKGIAWKSETDVRFGQPRDWKNTVKPINWPTSAQNRSRSSYAGDEDLIVWLRSAALPNFKKLHRIIDNTLSPFTNGLPRGDYRLSINYSFPVSSFYGEKSFIISETNYLGGKNPAMGITYLVVGTIYFSLGIAFLFINSFVARRYIISDDEKHGRQNEAWYTSAQSSGDNGVANETFCNMEAGDHSIFVDNCLNDSNNLVL